MKSDKNGCSTCAVGTESYGTFTRKIRRSTKKFYQYDYRHANGELFSIIRPSLEACRALRDEWLKTQV